MKPSADLRFQCSRAASILFLLVTLLCSASIQPVHPARAQAPGDEWSEPINLSQSGSASAPVLAVDTSGIIHVTWTDSISGSMYSHKVEGVWSEPKAVRFPFDGTTPVLLADQKGFIHALWIGRLGQLLHSKVIERFFGDPTNWAKADAVAPSAAKFTATLDAKDILHVAYVRPITEPANPAGIYYRRSTPSGTDWFPAINLYASPYYRAITADSTSISIAASNPGDGGSVFVAWDNRARKQVLLASSFDLGEIWTEPEVVDKPETGYENPFNLQVDILGENALLVWQSGDPTANCSKFYKNSGDGGRSWSSRQVMLEKISGCTQENQFFHLQGITLSVSIIQNQGYWTAWDGSQWSPAQFQSQMSSFQDPDTLALVDLSCRQLAAAGDQGLEMVGCDLGAGQDIWYLHRSLPDLRAWFLPASEWTIPTEVIQSSHPIGSPILIADLTGRFHALWTQAENDSVADTPAKIFYSSWDGDRWSLPGGIIAPNPGSLNDLDGAVDASGRLLLTWTNSITGELFFSYSRVNQAFSYSEWNAPITLPTPRNAVHFPHLWIDPTGVISVIYSIPINEQRGIYLVQSLDDGKTWTEPVRVFDGTADGWEVVGAPQVTGFADGSLHIVWLRYTYQGSSARGLYYAESKDGLDWSEAQAISEGDVTWGQIAAAGNQTLHILWQENTAGSRVLVDQVSQDGGLTWQKNLGMASFGELLETGKLVMDSAQQLHLVMLSANSLGTLSVRKWIWQGNRWTGEELINTGEVSLIPPNNLAAAIDRNGQFFILFSGQHRQAGSTGYQEQAYASGRVLELPAVIDTPAPAPTRRVLPTEESTPQPTQQPTRTPIPPLPTSSEDNRNDQPPSNSWAGLALGVGIAGVFAVAALVVGVRAMRKNP